jgi:hypothetical protein
MHLGCTPTTIYMNSDFGLTGSGDPFVLKFSKNHIYKSQKKGKNQDVANVLSHKHAKFMSTYYFWLHKGNKCVDLNMYVFKFLNFIRIIIFV